MRYVLRTGKPTPMASSIPNFGCKRRSTVSLQPVGNGTHIGFIAPTKEAVHAFYEAALKAGAIDDGVPGSRPAYSEPYYGCFVRDPDGHKVEAAFWDEQLEHSLTQAKDND